MVPFVYVLVLLVVGVGVSVLVTRAVMQPRIDEATAQANEAQEQVNTLTKRLENTIREATENEAALKAELEKAGKKSKDSEGGGTKSPWISSGGLSTGDETLDGEVKAFCDARTDSSMSQETAALEVYKGVAWSEYVERDDAQHPSGPNWRAEYARKYYENGCTGNCYEFAAFLMYCLRYLGYTDAQAEGVGIELESGMLGDHGLVFVTNTDGSACLCDTARGTDGWMIPADSYNMEIQDFESA